MAINSSKIEGTVIGSKKDQTNSIEVDHLIQICQYVGQKQFTIHITKYMYRNVPKFSDARKLCCNLENSAVICLKFKPEDQWSCRRSPSWPSKAQNLENIWLRNDLDLQYSHTFIYSNRCLLLPIFRSQAAIVSEKSTVFTFSHRKV